MPSTTPAASSRLPPSSRSSVPTPSSSWRSRRLRRATRLPLPSPRGLRYRHPLHATDVHRLRCPPSRAEGCPRTPPRPATLDSEGCDCRLRDGAPRNLDSDGAKAWDTVLRRGLEGFVAKDPQSIYRSGPSRSWVKVKLRHEGVFTVGGIRDVDAFDGVLVGQWVGDALHFRGVVEWGFHAADVLELLREAKCAPQRVSPFVDL